MPTKDRRSLPELGPRGEGWFVVQVILLAAVGLAGAVGPNWSGPARVAGVIFIVFGGVQAVRGSSICART